MEPLPGDPSLADLGEWELIRRLAAFAPPGQLEDDAALLDVGGTGGSPGLVVSTDAFVEGIHFSERTMGAEELGWRIAAANLSDLAAMGCTEVVGLSVALVAPGATPWSWVEGLYRGLSQVLDHHGGALLGGDCSSGQEQVVAVTAIGRLAGRNTGGVIRRAAGRPGDLLVSSGPHGLSRLGLALLLDEVLEPAGPALPQELRDRAVEAHRRPRPRLDVVRALGSSQPAGLAWRVAGTDSSDGLARAAALIASASGCTALLEHQRLPLPEAMTPLPQAIDWCLAGGEDFELVLALDPAWAAALCHRLSDCTVIGRLIAADPGLGPLAWLESREPIGSEHQGYRHFRAGNPDP